MAEGRIWAETGLDGSVWAVRAGKRNPSSNRDHPAGFRGLKRPFSAGFSGRPEADLLARHWEKTNF